MPLTPSIIARRRLHNQWISAPRRGHAEDIVDHLVAVQSQDYAGAKWALGLRLRRASHAAVEDAFNQGRILRTHVLRPTWHFVLPRDIRWLLALTGPRVQAQNAGQYRQANLDAATFKRARLVLQRALSGGQHLTRTELRERLEAAGVATSQDFRLAYVLMHAELEGLICSGPRRGRQFTYALLDERVPAGRELSRKDALTELSRRYFASRGPATAHDFAKWSGLTLSDARLGLEAIRSSFQHESLDGQEYWFPEPARMRRLASPSAHLLSVYDEYLSSYRGHAAIAPAEISARLRAFGNALSGVIVVDGLIVGTWKRTLATDLVTVDAQPFGKFAAAQRNALVVASQRYAEFHGLRAVVS